MRDRTANPMKNNTVFLSVLLALLLGAAACGSSSASDGAAGGDSGDAGSIAVSGSSTVEPISIAVAENFKQSNADVSVSVTGPGTGDGFKQFCAGETDVSDASRPIKEEEAEDCVDNGVEYVELKVGIDGIAVMTSHDNEAVECLAFGDLYSLIGPESTGFATWADANDLSSEVGGIGGLPDAELVISAPGTESGTYDSFVEIVLEGIAEERGQTAETRPDYSSAADDNVIVETISSNATSLGWVGFAYANENQDTVRMIPISEEAGGDCVEPDPDTIASNEYPISRDLYIYVNSAMAAEKPALVAFIDHYMDYGLSEAVAEVGYVPLTDDAQAATRDAWAGR